MPSNHLILCRPLLLLPSNFPTIRDFSSESTLRIRRPKYWNFSFNISPSNEHPGLISFKMDWLDLLAVQGTLKSLLQHHSSEASVLPCSAFFTVQLSNPSMTTEKTVASTRGNFVGKVMCLLFNMLSRSCGQEVGIPDVFVAPHPGPLSTSSPPAWRLRGQGSDHLTSLLSAAPRSPSSHPPSSLRFRHLFPTHVFQSRQNTLCC